MTTFVCSSYGVAIYSVGKWKLKITKLQKKLFCFKKISALKRAIYRGFDQKSDGFLGLEHFKLMRISTLY